MDLELLNAIDSFIWGPPLLVLLVGTGILLSVRLRFLQVFCLKKALSLIYSAKNNGEGDINSFKALCTALAATIGTGNIVGVATAVHAGGPGALFWMWMAAFFGMATKYAEGLLAVKYREVDAQGHISGGPMYYIKNGLGEKWKPLGTAFAIFGVLVAFFGIGTFAQVNSIVEITRITAGIPVEATAAVLTVLVAAVTLGGLQSISRGGKDRSGHGCHLFHHHHRRAGLFLGCHPRGGVPCAGIGLHRYRSGRGLPGRHGHDRHEKRHRQRRIFQ